MVIRGSIERGLTIFRATSRFDLVGKVETRFSSTYDSYYTHKKNRLLDRTFDVHKGTKLNLGWVLTDSMYACSPKHELQ